jgi:hypothetical protein
LCAISSPISADQLPNWPRIVITGISKSSLLYELSIYSYFKSPSFLINYFHNLSSFFQEGNAPAHERQNNTVELDIAYFGSSHNQQHQVRNGIERQDEDLKQPKEGIHDHGLSRGACTSLEFLKEYPFAFSFDGPW